MSCPYRRLPLPAAPAVCPCRLRFHTPKSHTGEPPGNGACRPILSMLPLPSLPPAAAADCLCRLPLPSAGPGVLRGLLSVAISRPAPGWALDCFGVLYGCVATGTAFFALCLDCVRLPLLSAAARCRCPLPLPAAAAGYRCRLPMPPAAAGSRCRLPLPVPASGAGFRCRLPTPASDTDRRL